MRQEVLDSFNRLITEVTQVDVLTSKPEAAGLCEFEFGGKGEPIARIKISRVRCNTLAQVALIGVFAHEFGHAEDRLFNGDNAETYKENAEATANQHAIFWGFKEELLVMHKELGFDPDEIPGFDENSLSEEAANDYWYTRPFHVQNLSEDASLQ